MIALMKEIDDYEVVTGAIVSVAEATPRAELILATPYPPDQNPARVYLARLLSPRSQRVMESSLVAIAATIENGATPDTLAWHRLRFHNGMALRAALMQKYEPRSVNRMLSALRGTIETAIDLGLMDDGDGAWRIRMHGVKYDKHTLSGRALEVDEVVKLMNVCDKRTLAGARDAALLAFLFGAALRRAEIAGIEMPNFDAATGRVRVVGKGSKKRTVQLPKDAAEVVREYIAMRGNVDGPMLVSFTLHGELRIDETGVPTGLTPSGVYDVLIAIAGRADKAESPNENVPSHRLTPHDARRTRITHMIAGGESLAFVKRVAGHESSETTDRYDQTKDELAHAASSRVSMLK